MPENCKPMCFNGQVKLFGQIVGQCFIIRKIDIMNRCNDVNGVGFAQCIQEPKTSCNDNADQIGSYPLIVPEIYLFEVFCYFIDPACFHGIKLT